MTVGNITKRGVIHKVIDVKKNSVLMNDMWRVFKDTYI